MLDTPLSYTSQPQSSNKSKTWIIVLVLIVVAAAIGSYFFLNQSKKTEEAKTAVEAKKGPAYTPSPTKKPIEKEKVKIQVLNGTGTPGQAGTAVEALTKAGYKTENIKTGNAEKFDQTSTTISAKKGFEDVAIDIKDSLKSSFDNVKVDSTELDEKSEFDIVVTTGGKIFEETTPTPSPKPTLSTLSPTPASITETPTPSPTPSPTPTP